jgi:hypothetical protein
MTKVHSEVYLGKTIEIFKYTRWDFCRNEYGYEIDGEKQEGYATMSRALGAAKSHLKKSMTKNQEIAKIENEIAELQIRLEALKNS